MARSPERQLATREDKGMGLAFNDWKGHGVAVLAPEQAQSYMEGVVYANSSYVSNRLDYFDPRSRFYQGPFAIKLSAATWADLPVHAVRGFFEKEETCVRLMERSVPVRGGPAKNVAVVSFSGSDDFIDFVQDASLLSFYKANPGEGQGRKFIAKLLETAKEVGLASAEDLRNNPEMVLNALEKLGRGVKIDAGVNTRNFERSNAALGAGLAAGGAVATGYAAVAAAPVAVPVAAALGVAGYGVHKLAGVDGFVGAPARWAEAKAAQALLSKLSGVKSADISGSDIDEVASKFAKILEARMLAENPDKHYAKMAEGRAAAIDGIIKNHARLDEIAIGGHSLGGHLSARFAKELVERLDALPDRAAAADILSKIRLRTVNSIGHDPETLAFLEARLPKGAFEEFREPGDLTEIAQRSNQLAIPKNSTVWVAQLDPAAKHSQALSAFRLGKRHSCEEAEARAAAVKSKADYMDIVKNGPRPQTPEEIAGDLRSAAAAPSQLVEKLKARTSAADPAPAPAQRPQA